MFFVRVKQLYPLSDLSGAYFDNPFSSLQTTDALDSRLNVSFQTTPEYCRAKQIYGDYVINCLTYYQAIAFSEYNLSIEFDGSEIL